MPAGGTLEPIGWAMPDDKAETGIVDEVWAELDELFADREVKAVTRIYRGPTEYAVPIPIGDGCGGTDYEFEFKPTQAEAEAYLAAFYEGAEAAAAEDTADGRGPAV